MEMINKKLKAVYWSLTAFYWIALFIIKGNPWLYAVIALVFILQAADVITWRRSKRTPQK